MNQTITRMLSAIHAIPDRPHSTCPGYEHWLAEQVYNRATEAATLAVRVERNVIRFLFGAKMQNKKILDPCCGSKMFWFDRENPDVLFGDIRDEEHTLCDWRELKIKPDMLLDFRDMPFQDGTFKLVVFDPPHLKHVGEKSWMYKKYGGLSKTWQEDLRAGFAECFRVLQQDGILIFKWNEDQIKTSEVLKLAERKPLFGHPSGKAAKTHWLCFMKTYNDAIQGPRSGPAGMEG